MAEEDTRTGASGGGAGGRGDGEGGGVGSGEDEGEEGDVGRRDWRRYGDGSGDEAWLQLSLGTSQPLAVSTSEGSQPAGILELNLFPDRPSADSLTTPSTSLGMGTPMTPLLPTSTYLGHLPVSLQSWAAAGAGASSSVPVPVPPPHGPWEVMYMSESGGSGFPVAGGDRTPGESSVVSRPPPRRRTGLWFFLRASENQAQEPFLAQIPRSCLRIKDERTTIRLLMKYLVHKLGLDNESEVEITCRGQQLQPHLTLQYVRDQIWRPRDAVVDPSDSPVNHVMRLQYGRSPSNLV